jgi:hypothetical protein
MLTNIIIIVSALFVLSFIFKGRIQNYHSNWNSMIDNFNFSSEEFYELLSKEVLSHDIPNIKTQEVFLSQLGALSPKRLYLRIDWKGYRYYICCAPFGNGVFFSSWLLYRTPFLKSVIDKVPVVGTWMANSMFPTTFYTKDTASMLMTYMHESLLKVIDQVTKEKGIRSLSESERKPTMNNIFKR